MKVAILLLNKGRGSGVVAKEHAEFLIGKGHVVYFMHPNIDAGVQGAHNIDVDLEGRIMPVHEYLPAAKLNQKAVSSMGFDEAMAYLPAYERALEGVIQDIDIVIGHHANLIAIATANICQKHNKPYVLFLHGTGIEPRHMGLYDDALWELIQKAIIESNGIIVTTEYVRDELVRKLINLPVEKFLVQPCGVNTNEFHPDNIEGIIKKYNLPDKYVICPGALTRVKGPQNVAEASKIYADIAPTIFIGDGELRDELEIQLGDRGKFLGFVSNADKAKLINAATLLVAAPEKKEHFGIIFIEAMSGGTPVVTYDGGGVNSIVTTDTGVLTKRSPADLGNAIRILLLDDNKLTIMAHNCIERARRFYASNVLGPRLATWLKDFL